MQVKLRSNLNKKNRLTVRSIVIYHFMKKQRDYFQKWKQESERHGVVVEMEEEGPVRLEVLALR
jgi:hypothetical protein